MNNPYVKAAMVIGGLYVASKYVPSAPIKAGLYGVMCTIALKQVPFVKESLA